jgi:F-type H+-transporting ATPase subunit gamma
MASLKEVKQRIASVESTKKITEARQMVSSAQFHHTQGVLAHAIAYDQSLRDMYKKLLTSERLPSTPLTEEHSAGPVVLVVFSSNSGMCGSFNMKMEKEISKLAAHYAGQELSFITVGKKGHKVITHMGHHVIYDFDLLANKAPFGEVRKMANLLIELFLSKNVKQIDLLYYHFKSSATQEIRLKTFLPYPAGDLMLKETYSDTYRAQTDYILEPSLQKLLTNLLTLLINSELFTTFAGHQTSEHAARMMAMQLASENANELLDELHLTYNKVRQQNITTELLDIIGSSFA